MSRSTASVAPLNHPSGSRHLNAAALAVLLMYLAGLLWANEAWTARVERERAVLAGLFSGH